MRNNGLNGDERLIKRMMKKQYTLGELKIGMSVIRKLRDMGYRIRSQHSPKGRVYYITTEAENNSLFVSKLSKEVQEVKWVELSDIHAGSIQFDEQGLRYIMQRAIDEGYTDFHISGDLCDGLHVYKGHLNNLRYWTAADQANHLTEILLDYDVNYIAITGNHDFSFVQRGGINPIAHIEQNMAAENRNFIFLDNFAGDLVICGVLKRMVHLKAGRAYAKSYPGQTYIRNLLDASDEHAYVGGNRYRMRFLQFGHLHFDISYQSAGMYCTHPGNFQFPNDFTIRVGLVGPQGARFTTALIERGKILDYTSTFVKPRR